MSATGEAAAGAAILPGYRHPGIQSGFAGLSRQTLLDMHSDPARIIRTFNGSYKSMKLQPKIELLDGANNYALWCQRMTCILLLRGYKQYTHIKLYKNNRYLQYLLEYVPHSSGYNI